MLENFPKLIRPGLDRSPKLPFNKLKKMFKVNEEIIEPKNMRHVRPWFQKLAPSSKLNKTPPTGAPNAAATPAAAPPDTKSLFSFEETSYQFSFEYPRSQLIY